MNEAKKGFRAKKHRVASVEPSKPRNFVAKNAKMGGAGAHKDKKKAHKFGDTKHKKDYVEHLQTELEIEMLVERQINETGLDPLRRMKAIQYIANKTGWEINYLELASDEEIMDLYVKVKKGEPVGEAGYGRNRGYAHGFASPTAPSLNRPYRDLSDEGEPEGMFAVVIDGRPWKEFTSNKAFHVASTIAGKNPNKKVQVRWPDGTLNTVKGWTTESRDMCSVCGQTPCNCTHVTEGAKVDRQAAHITKSMMKKGKSREEAEAIAWAHIKHPKKKKKKAHEGWTHDTLAAELFEQELTYEDTLNNMLAKELKK